MQNAMETVTKAYIYKIIDKNIFERLGLEKILKDVFR
jgi:hypothetical protein